MLQPTEEVKLGRVQCKWCQPISNVYLIDRGLIQQTNMMELLYYYLYCCALCIKRVKLARLYLLAPLSFRL